ncbi:hybrid sensor histidine kinase/response regulator [Scytonema hofmannii PCC 7110]|uniref:histidine kinase n=1 Tax=Scytonema hofmannii PCC 7110 TaxID=128403 RepID=A0A139XGN9_9CYAN|nr:response regulator [Scytonema hofmannii]KYC43841.1 hybrid sensor histidine kinase/response regulator [Scytonema hofmannii PCC 7110]
MREIQLILVVDDTPANLAVTSEALTDAGFEVAIAKDGERAIKQAERNLPDLILLDIMMPGIDGFETCRRLKASPITQEIPIIFMTALSDTTDKVTGFNLGGVDYITKPFQEAELLARVKTHLKLRLLTQNLEQQVAERTAELTGTVQQLQQSQFQLIQSEKMATLGLLMAGVAHEINNPVNFIHGNLGHIEEYTQTLIEFIQLYQKHYPHPAPEIQAKTEDEDLEFLQEDLLKILTSIKMGSDRIREIVKNLRNFSRTDELEVQAVDIHEGIDSTLTILQHRLKAHCDRPVIEIIKDYSALPLVECYPGPLNQAFMNILVNAIDALEDSFYAGQMSLKKLTISIHTSVIDAQWIEIAIADNGRGIPEQIKQRIFDPFFTTKPVNKGTGMGLSISYQIITDKHNGKLECFSTPQAGAEFVMQIPIQQCQKLKSLGTADERR